MSPPVVSVCSLRIDSIFARRDTIMHSFRCYLMDSADHIVSVDSIEAEDDASAMQLADTLSKARNHECAGIEVGTRRDVWDGSWIHSPTPPPLTGFLTTSDRAASERTLPKLPTSSSSRAPQKGNRRPLHDRTCAILNSRRARREGYCLTYLWV